MFHPIENKWLALSFLWQRKRNEKSMKKLTLTHFFPCWTVVVILMMTKKWNQLQVIIPCLFLFFKVVLIHRFGHVFSYSQTEELETALAHTETAKQQDGILVPSICSIQVPGVFCWNNNDLLEEPCQVYGKLKMAFTLSFLY